MSKEKGTPKRPVESGVLKAGWGLEGDAHAGKWHRQVSLLGLPEIKVFRSLVIKQGLVKTPEEAERVVHYGAFGENLVIDTDGPALAELPIGTRFRVGETLLELTQIGKECHDYCQIRKTMGDCIMPRKGVFARVVSGGAVKAGDEFSIEQVYRCAVVTVSDRSSRGEREDKSGPEVRRLAEEHGFACGEIAIVPDERDQIESALRRLASEERVSGGKRLPYHLVFTTGGTGFAPRDVTPEATLAVCEKHTPGIAEAMRAASMKITPRAMLSRAEAGILGQTLIVNLPGSPKAAGECLEAVIETLKHGLEVLSGGVLDCGLPEKKEK
jgi:molybdenum cofactor synthesis domain-containing protein